MQKEACLLTAGVASPESLRLGKLLTFFGIKMCCASVATFRVTIAESKTDDSGTRLFCSAAALLRLIQAQPHLESIHSVFVYTEGESTSELLTALTDGAGIPTRKKATCADWQVADAADGFCGAMSGLRVHPTERAGLFQEVANPSNRSAHPIIFAGIDTAFFRLTWRGIPIFISLTEEVIDLDHELDTANFDIRDHFFSAVPIVLYLRWAFRKSAWQPPETAACLIIDDPLLKPRYGFLRFRSLLDLMERYNFSTSVAFIPWNWRRSDPGTVRLFKENQGRFSLSIHGCDHTKAEFETENSEKARSMISAAAQRMGAHERKTGLTHDRIMVFPQGVFSETALRELKAANFVAAVNTEVMPARGRSRRLKISDVWDLAVRTYAEFPIYTRRYPQQGVENFAFDLLLGKPCLVVIHHDFCREDCRHLVEFIQSLNSLRTHLVWRSLQEVVKHSYRQRETDDGVVEIEMYGAEIAIENLSARPKSFRIKRKETEPGALDEIRAGSDPISWSMEGDYLCFEINLPPGQGRVISVRRLSSGVSLRKKRVHSHIKTALRRYLSEFRDNYAVPAKARFGAFSHG